MSFDLQKLRDLYAKAEAASKILEAKYTTENLTAFGRVNNEFGDTVYEAFPSVVARLEALESFVNEIVHQRCKCVGFPEGPHCYHQRAKSLMKDAFKTT